MTINFKSKVDDDDRKKGGKIPKEKRTILDPMGHRLKAIRIYKYEDKINENFPRAFIAPLGYNNNKKMKHIFRLRIRSLQIITSF